MIIETCNKCHYEIKNAYHGNSGTFYIGPSDICSYRSNVILYYQSFIKCWGCLYTLNHYPLYHANVLLMAIYPEHQTLGCSFIANTYSQKNGFYMLTANYNQEACFFVCILNKAHYEFISISPCILNGAYISKEQCNGLLYSTLMKESKGGIYTYG